MKTILLSPTRSPLPLNSWWLPSCDVFLFAKHGSLHEKPRAAALDVLFSEGEYFPSGPDAKWPYPAKACFGVIVNFYD